MQLLSLLKCRPVATLTACLAMLTSTVLASRVVGAPPDASSGGQQASQSETVRTPTDYYHTRKQALELVGRARYNEALPLFEALTEFFDKDGENWWRLARCQAAAQDYTAAIDSYQRAIELGFGDHSTHTHQVAGLYSKLGKHGLAFEWLEKSLASPLEERRSLYRDLRVRELKPTERMREVVGLLPQREFSRDEGWRYDLAFFTAEAERMHYNPWRRTTREDFHAAVAQLHERIPDLSDDQIVVELQKLACMLGDGHSGVALDTKLTPVTPLPVAFYLFKDGLFVIDADDQHRDLIGSRVENIGGVPTDEVFVLLRQIVSHDNLMGVDWLGPRLLRVPSVLENLGLAGDPSQVEMTIVDVSGAERSVILEPAPFGISRRLIPSRLAEAPPPPLHLKNVDQTFWFEHLPEQDAVYVQFNQVRDDPDEPLEEFALRLRRFLVEHPDLQNLIVDVRHNSGGNTYLTIPLLKTLIYFETSREGQLYAIIGRNTFSACQNFATEIDRLTDATLVGEPTGSSPNSIGESTDVVLPYSRVGAHISTRYWQTSWPRDRRVWIAPDVPAELSSSDYFANRDPALTAIFELIGQHGH